MKITPDIFRFVTLYLLSKSILKINGIELINHGIICQIIEKSFKLNFEKHISNVCKKVSNQQMQFADCKHLWVIKKKKQ